MTAANIRAWIDQEDARVVEIVRRHGWFVQYVTGGTCTAPRCGCNDRGPAFAYTIGLFGLHHPELLIFGASGQAAAGVLNNLGGRVRAGATLMPGQMLTFAEWAHRVVPEMVPNPGEIVLGANRFYDRSADASVPVLQLSYDDKAGRFPWDRGYIAPHLQPRPGTFRA